MLPPLSLTGWYALRARRPNETAEKEAVRKPLGLVPAQGIPIWVPRVWRILLGLAGFRRHPFFLGTLVRKLFTLFVAHRSSLPEL
jgi:hypothetical protein